MTNEDVTPTFEQLDQRRNELKFELIEVEQRAKEVFAKERAVKISEMLADKAKYCVTEAEMGYQQQKLKKSQPPATDRQRCKNWN